MDVSIAKTTEQDAKHFEVWLNDPEITKWLSSIYRYNKYDALFHRFALRKNDNIFFTVKFQELPIGFVGVTQIDKAEKSGMVFVVLGEKKHGGRGIMSKALNLALNKLFFEFDFHSINAWILEDNNPSIRMVKNNNFKQIGIQRECHLVEGAFKNRILFDILKNDFKRLA